MIRPLLRLLPLVLPLSIGAMPQPAHSIDLTRADRAFRIATFNADMARKGAGVLINDIAKRQEQILNVAEILLRVRPDIVLLNEIDHDPEGRALRGFADLLRGGVRDLPGLDYPHHFLAPSNTGVPSGADLDGDGKTMGPGDAIGYGRFPGQYGMAILSQVELGRARTFRNFAWSRIPWARTPVNPNGTVYYSPAVWKTLPFSSKSHWDVSAVLPGGKILHLLASHPTPPVFDGPEDRNGLRNAAEIRFWSDYINGAAWIEDDTGTPGGLGAETFVILGDLNNDPIDGDGDKTAIRDLLGNLRVQDPAPHSPGAATARGQQSDTHGADPAQDTADWREDADGPGNLRVDYALPSTDLTVTGSGVFWPAREDPLARLTQVKRRKRASSDHRLVWVDIATP